MESMVADDEEHYTTKNLLMRRSVVELQCLCARVRLSPGRATKECMVLALMAEHEFLVHQLQGHARVEQLVASRRRRARGKLTTWS